MFDRTTYAQRVAVNTKNLTQLNALITRIKDNLPTSKSQTLASRVTQRITTIQAEFNTPAHNQALAQIEDPNTTAPQKDTLIDQLRKELEDLDKQVNQFIKQTEADIKKLTLEYTLSSALENVNDIELLKKINTHDENINAFKNTLSTNKASLNFTDNDLQDLNLIAVEELRSIKLAATGRINELTANLKKILAAIESDQKNVGVNAIATHTKDFNNFKAQLIVFRRALALPDSEFNTDYIDQGQLEQIRNHAITHAKVLNVIAKINSLTYSSENLEVLEGIAAIDDARAQQVETALTQAIGKNKLAELTISVNDLKKSPTKISSPQHLLILNAVRAQFKTFKLIDTIEKFKQASRNSIREALNTIASTDLNPADNHAEVRQQINANTANLGLENNFLAINGRDVIISQQQLETIHQKIRNKSALLNVNHAIDNLNDYRNNNFRNLLDELTRANNTEEMREILRANAARLALRNANDLNDEQVNVIHKTLRSKNKYFNAMNSIQNLNNFENDAVFRELTIISKINRTDSNALRTALANKAVLQLDENDLTEVKSDLSNVSDLIQAKLKLFTAYRIIQKLSNTSLNQLANIANAGDDATSIQTAIAQIDRNFNIQNIDNFVTDLHAIRTLANNRYRQLTAIDIIRRIQHTNEEAQNNNLRTSLSRISNTLDLDPVQSLNTERNNLGLNAIANFDGLSRSQITEIQAAAKLKHNELSAISAITSQAYTSDATVLGALKNIKSTASNKLELAKALNTNLNTNKDKFNLNQIDFNNLELNALTNIQQAAKKKHDELHVIRAINTIETRYNDQPNQSQALVVLAGLNSHDLDTASSIQATRRYLKDTWQQNKLIDDIGLNNNPANDANILDDAAITRIQHAAQAKMRSLNRSVEPNHNQLAELRKALNDSRYNVNAQELNTKLNPVLADHANSLAGTASNVLKALQSLNSALLAQTPPTALALRVKDATIGLEQELIWTVKDKLDQGLSIVDLKPKLNADLERALKTDSGLSFTHPMRAAMIELQNEIKKLDNAQVAEPEQIINAATDKYNLAVEKYQLLAISKIFRDPSLNTIDEFEILLPHLASEKGLARDHALKRQNLLSAVINAIASQRTAERELKNAGQNAAANLNEAVETAKKTTQEAIDRLKEGVKERNDVLRMNVLEPSMKNRAAELNADEKLESANTVMNKLDNFQKAIFILKADAKQARNSRNRDKVLPEIIERLTKIKLQVYNYREMQTEKLTEVHNSQPLTVEQTQDIIELNDLINQQQPNAAQATNADIRNALTPLMAGGPHVLAGRHVLYSKLHALFQAVRNDNDAIPAETLNAVKQMLDAAANIQPGQLNYLSLDAAEYEANQKARQERDAYHALQIREAQYLLVMADDELGKNERALQKPIKIKAPETGIVQEIVVVPKDQVRQTITDFKQTQQNLQNGGGLRNDQARRVRDYNGETEAKVTHCVIHTVGVYPRLSLLPIGIHTGPLDIVIAQHNDDAHRHVADIYYDKSKVGFFTSKDTYIKWAVTAIEDYIGDHSSPPKTISIVGDLPEKLVWQMMLYCHFRGIKPANFTKHSNLTEKFEEVFKTPENPGSDYIDLVNRVYKLFPNEIYLKHSDKLKKRILDEVPSPPPPKRPAP